MSVIRAFIGFTVRIFAMVMVATGTLVVLAATVTEAARVWYRLAHP